MFLELGLKSLISKQIILNFQYEIQGDNLIVNTINDFEDAEAAIKTIKERNIKSLTYSDGSNYPMFIGAGLVENIIANQPETNDIMIPKYLCYRSVHIKTLTVNAEVSIGPYAFAYSTIQTINNIQNVKAICESAFEGCSNLNLVGLINHCQKNCLRFTKIVNLEVKTIDPFGLQEMHELETVTIQSALIPEKAFYNCFKLTTVTISVQNTQILKSAFENCGIQAFNFEHISEIDSWAFRNTKLQSIELPNSNLKLYNGAFCQCPFLTTVTITDSVTIADFSGEQFKECYSLETVDYRNTNKVPTRMFMFCYKLATFKSINNNLDIEEEAFYSCTSLRNIDSNQVGNIYDKAFIYCISLREFNPTYSRIGHKAFYGCQNLQITNIHNCGRYSFAYCSSISTCTLKNSLDDGTMMNCTGLTSVSFENIVRIPFKCFQGCTNLETISLSASVKNIDINAFLDTNLNMEELDLSNCQKIGSFAFKNTKIKSLIFSNVYNTDEENGIPFDGVTTIKKITYRSSYAFRPKDFRDSTNIEIVFEDNNFQIKDDTIIDSSQLYYYYPSSPSNEYTVNPEIRQIMSYAFAGATNLKSITINHYIGSDSKFALANCKSLQTINIDFQNSEGYSLSIPCGFFANCINLITVNLGQKISMIEKGAFEGCISLTSIVIPSDTKELSDYCFTGCTKLEKIEFLADSVKLKGYCFANCTSLNEIKFNEIIQMYKYCISGCKSLTKLNVENIKSISANAFSFSYLENIKVPANLLQYENAFRYCNNLKKVELFVLHPEFYHYVKSGCFNSSSLEEIVLPDRIQSLEEFSFGFTKLKKLFIPNSVYSISPKTFYGSDDIQLEMDCSHPFYTVGEYELVEKATGKLVLTFGKLPSAYIVPENIKIIGRDSIFSPPKINEETKKVIDFGLTT